MYQALFPPPPHESLGTMLGVIVFVGSFYSGDLVIGRSIYGVVVIDGSLYSRFYGDK